MDPNTTPDVGTEVKKGDPIGNYANPTNGNSTGPHVHHESRDKYGNITDPGDKNPTGPGGRKTSGYGETDSAHSKPHQGNDWAYK